MVNVRLGPMMKSPKTLIKRQLLPLVLTGFTVCLALIANFLVSPPQQSAVLPLTATNTALYKIDSPPDIRSELPVRLKIPKIDVDAPIEYVALTVAGDMDVPKGPANAAWFALGPRPGEIGSSVIGGHFGWRNNIPAIFDNLSKLVIGDRVHVETKPGETITFVVRGSRSYNPDQNTSDVFFSDDNKAHLNLITCKGSWSKIDSSYSDRLVVFADKEEG